MLIVIPILATVFILLPGIILFVSIVWTHRPDLSIVDIMLLTVAEIRDIISLKAGERLRRKGKWRK